MAEWILKDMIKDNTKEICSRGLVVLFPEPRNLKVTEVLESHHIKCDEQNSQEIDREDIDENTLILTMTFAEKVNIMEKFELENNVYTIKEFIEDEEEGDVLDPYGGDEEVYEECYEEMKKLLLLVKKKIAWR